MRRELVALALVPALAALVAATRSDSSTASAHSLAHQPNERALGTSRRPATAAHFWRREPAIPVARTEVAAVAARGRIVVVGGYLGNGKTSARADEYTPVSGRWRRLPNLPVAVNHAMAASWNGRVYVVGGYPESRRAIRDAFVLERGRWRRLPQMPAPRAAAGTVAVGGRLYVVGGVTEDQAGRRSLARQAFVFDLRRRRWTAIPGPTPREHLAVAGVQGRVYALAGRTAGLDTNLTILERYAPGSRSWVELTPIPSARGGTGAAGGAGLLVSVGGEAPTGTIGSVFTYDPSTAGWTRRADLPRPRHGLGVVVVGSRVYAIAGGPRPGLTVSDASESLEVH